MNPLEQLVRFAEHCWAHAKSTFDPSDFGGAAHPSNAATSTDTTVVVDSFMSRFPYEVFALDGTVKLSIEAVLAWARQSSARGLISQVHENTTVAFG